MPRPSFFVFFFLGPRPHRRVCFEVPSLRPSPRSAAHCRASGSTSRPTVSRRVCRRGRCWRNAISGSPLVRVFCLVGPTGSGQDTFVLTARGSSTARRGVVASGATSTWTERAGLDLRARVALLFQERFLFNRHDPNNSLIGKPMVPDEAPRLCTGGWLRASAACNVRRVVAGALRPPRS